MDADSELIDEVLPAAGKEETSPQCKKRGRPRGSKNKKDEDPDDDDPAPPVANKRRKSSGSGAGSGTGGTGAGALAKSKVQCMCCGKVFDRSAMANSRYCVDGKKITDRLYHAAKAQDQVEWLADQLSTLEGSMRIVGSFKARFPQWKTQRSDTKRFVTQYIEMVVAESAVVWDGDGIMMTEARYVLEMAKPEHGGYSGKAARDKCAILLNDPTSITDKKNGVDRVRVDLDDHVRFQNKFSRLKQVIQSQQAKKNMGEEEVQALQARVFSGHDQGFANQDVDMVSMGRRMAVGAGRGATAFDAEMMQMGNLQDLVSKETTPEKKKKKNRGNGSDSEAGDIGYIS